MLSSRLRRALSILLGKNRELIFPPILFHAFEALEDRTALDGGGGGGSAVLTQTSPPPTGTYVELVGQPPPPTSIAWESWYEELRAARITYSDQARAQTYYFSQAGSDSAGDGSLANPFRSLAKAQAILNQSAGNVALLFRRGDEWREAAGLDVLQSQVTIGDYGDPLAAKPLFSAFTTVITASSGTWTNGGGGRWTAAASGIVGWIRESTSDAARLSPFAHVESIAEVGATARSWYWDGALLHFNPGTGIDPNSRSYEATGNPMDDGIQVSGNGSLLRNIRCDGWGCVAGTQYQNYGIRATPSGTASIVVIGCESYYQGRHGISMHNPFGNAQGGFALFQDCVTGYMNATDAGVTAFNSYQDWGGNETIFDNCTVRFGSLPMSGLLGAFDDSSSFYGHSTPGHPTSLFIVRACQTTVENLPGATYANGRTYFDPGSLPGNEADPSSFRAYVVDTNVTHGLNGRLAFTPKIAFMNCDWVLTFPASDLEAFIGQGAGISGGIVINATLDLRNLAPNQQRWILSSNSANTTRFLNCHIQVDGLGTIENPSTVWQLGGANVRLTNTILSRVGSQAFYPNVTNSAANLVSNASFHTRQSGPYGVDQDVYQVILPTAPVLSALPTGALEGGLPNPFGQSLEYDRSWAPRSLLLPSIGPVNTQVIPPTAPTAGGPYTIAEGTSLSLSAVGSATTGPSGPLSFTWDVNGDGLFGDATGIEATLPWNALQALGINDGPSGHRVSVRAVATDGTFQNSAVTLLNVINAGPSTSISAQSFGVRNFQVLFTLAATDPSSADQAKLFGYDIDWNGDGTFDQTVNGGATVYVPHTFATAGTFLVRVAARDFEGASGPVATRSIAIGNWGLIPSGPNLDLAYSGTEGVDAVAFIGGGTTVTLLRMFENSRYVYATHVFTGVTGVVLASGLGGDDFLDAELLFGRSVNFAGGAGNDVLVGGNADDILAGDGGNDLVIGLAGNDGLTGGDGDDLLIGGLGIDGLFGGAGSDLLLAGVTLYETSPDAIFGIQAEWTSGRPLAERVANLTGTGSGTRYNGDFFLIPSPAPAPTVVDEQAVDFVMGGTGADWLLCDPAEDLISGLSPTEDILTPLAP